MPSRRLRRAWRRLTSRFIEPRVAFVYSGRYRVELPGVPSDPHRAENILTFLALEGWVRPGDLHWPRSASLHTLGRVHTEDYLTAVFRPGGTERIVGFQLPSALEDRFLSAQRHMAGGTVLATRLALTGGRPAVNLGGGLHHAHADHGRGFCAFNDIAIAIAQAREGGFDGPVLVIDLDLHDGDGTRRIFADDPTVHTFSIHNDTWGEVAARGATTLELGEGVEDAAYLEALERYLPAVVREVRPRLVYYLAGCDPAADDTLGNWRLTNSGLLRRDRFVLETLAEPLARGASLVVALAGGYGTGAWRYTARFLAEWLTGDAGHEPPSTDEILLQRYRYLAQLIEEDQLTGAGETRGEDDWGFSNEDLMPGAVGIQKKTRLLDYYSTHGVEMALERYGLLSRLREKGFERPAIGFDLENPTGQTLTIFTDATRTELLCEARLRRDRRTVPGHEILFVEWLLLQDPRAQFEAARPRLPGQRHPGLGMLRDVVSLFMLICERLELDGVGFVPAHYHLAAQSHRLLRFVDPVDEARFRALRRDLAELALPEASRAIAEGRVRQEGAAEPFSWPPRPMLIPVGEAMSALMETERYEQAVEQALPSFTFRLAPPGDYDEDSTVSER